MSPDERVKRRLERERREVEAARKKARAERLSMLCHLRYCGARDEALFKQYFPNLKYSPQAAARFGKAPYAR